MELCGLRAAATGVIVGASTAVALSWLASSKHLGRASSQQHRRIPTANINPAGGLGGESGGFGRSRRAAERRESSRGSCSTSGRFNRIFNRIQVSGMRALARPASCRACAARRRRWAATSANLGGLGASQRSWIQSTSSGSHGGSSYTVWPRAEPGAGCAASPFDEAEPVRTLLGIDERIELRPNGAVGDTPFARIVRVAIDGGVLPVGDDVVPPIAGIACAGTSSRSALRGFASPLVPTRTARTYR